jgi:hypothetical protein
MEHAIAATAASRDEEAVVPEGALLVEALPPPPKAKLQRREATFRTELWDAEFAEEPGSTR